MSDWSGAKEAKPTREQAEEAVRILIQYAGDDPTRDGLIKTPKRVVDAYAHYFSGYLCDPARALATTFEQVSCYDDFVMLKNIPFYSHCEHHMAPFFGHVHLAYWPVDKLVGLSKFARLVDIFARRLQTQETMTSQIADLLQETLHPKGVAVLLEAEHQCMSMRGVMKPGILTTTMKFHGVFQEDAQVQKRFLHALRVGSGKI